MTKNLLSKPLKKKVIILTSVFLALIAGLSTSALWLNSRHEQKVAAAIPEKRYSGNKIVQTDKELTSDDIGKDGSGIELTSLSDSEIVNVKAGADTSDETYVIEQNGNGDVASSESNESEKSPAVVKTDGKHIYLVNYTDASKKQKSAYDKYVENSKNTVSNDEIIFQTADNEGSENNTDASTGTSVDLGGKSLREYADEQGKKLVAVIDTGINDGYAVQSVNFSNSKSDADVNGHGTKIAKEIQSASGDKAIIVSLKAMDDNGTGDMFNVMKAVQYAIDQKVDIINMSIVAADDGNSSIFKSVVKSAVDQKIKVVAAAGNYGLKGEHFIPANIDGVIAVGAVNDNGEVADFSNYGLDNQVYVKNATSTSLAAAEVTGTIVANGSTDKNDNITKDYHLSLNKKLDEIFSGNDKNKFITANYLDANCDNQVLYLYVGSGKGWFEERDSSTNKGEVSASDTNTSNNRLKSSAGSDHVLNIHQSDFYFYPASGYRLSYMRLSGTYGSPVKYLMGDQQLTTPADGDGNYAGWYWTTDQWGQDVWKINTGSHNLFQPNSSGYTTATAYFEPYVAHVHFDGGGGTLQWNTDQTFRGDASGQSFKDTGAYRTGYEFVEWDGDYGPYSYTTGVSNTWLRNVNGISGNNASITVTAKWKAIPYTISYNKGTIDKYYDTNWYYGPTGQWYYNDVQTMPGSRTVIYQQKFQLPSSSEATAKGYTLRGWKLDGTSTIYSPGQTVTAQPNNMSFTAVWSQNDDHTMKITTNVNDKESADLTNPVNGEQIYSVTATTQRINRENVGSESWTGDSNNKKRGSDNLITFNRSTLRQGYTNQDNKTYDFYEGGRWNNTKGTDATSANRTADFGKDGQPTITARVSHEANSSQELVMYVRGNTYNVIFDPNDMTGAAKDGFVTPDDSQFVRHNGPATVTRSFTYGKNETIPDNLGISWPGHKLVGWSTSPNPYKDSNAITYLVNTNNNDRTSWYFGYIGGYRNNGTTKNTTSGIDASFAPSSDGIVPDNASQIVTKDHAIVLYAVWERNNVSITIDPNNGTWDGNGRKTSRTVKWGDDMLLGSQQNGMVTPPDNAVSVTYNPEKGTIDRTSDTSNYEFDHWLILDTASQKEAKDLDHGFIRTKTESKSGDGTNQYFAGAQATTLQAKYYYTIITLPLPAREGYTFLGWYYDDAYMEAAGKAGDEYRIPARKAREYNNHVTLYARWVKNDYQYGDTIDSRMENLNSPDHQPETYKFAIGKTNRNGTPLDGAVIEISQAKYVNDQPSFDPDNVVLTMDESKGGLIDKNGKVLVSTKNAGMYTYETKNKNDIPLTENTIYVARETKAPQGYFTADDYSFTYTGYDTITIRDDKISTDLSLIKNSIYPNQTIENAKFALYNLTKDPNKQNILAIAVSNEQGKIQLRSDYITTDKKELADYITAGDEMMLHEYEAPVNFQVQDFKFTVPKQKQKIDTIPFEYVPDAKQALILDNQAYINLKVTKLDGQDKTKKLPNVTFQLFVMKDGALYPAVRDRFNNQLLDPYKDAEEYQENKDNIITATTGSIPGTDDYGVATFTNLLPKALATGSDDTEKDQYIAEIDDNGKESDWYLKEIKNPNKGYNLLSKPMILRISEDEVRERREAGENTPTFYFNVYNGKVIETLNAGGNGTLSYVLIGTVLLIVGAAYLHKRKKFSA